MISSEVQRTLVKSPPELWAELGDPTSLARHLGELGEIRITRTEPEKLVEWEAESAKGTVAMKGSGWGTKVTLTASRELPPSDPTPSPEDEPAAHEQPSSAGEELLAAERPIDEPEALGEETSALEDEPSSSGLDAWSRQQAEGAVTAAERFSFEHSATLLGTDLQRASDLPAETDDEKSFAEPFVSAEPLPSASSEATAEPGSEEPAVEVAEPRRGLFARLFKFGRKRPAAAPTAAEVPVSKAPMAPAEPADAIPTAADAIPAVAGSDPERAIVANEAESLLLESSEPADVTVPVELEIPPAEMDEADEPQPAAEAPSPSSLTDELRAAEEEVEAILTGVLDRLGAAHHRPFSRS